jgi:hypothetical protein
LWDQRHRAQNRIFLQVKAVFPKDELIGWYTNGIEMTDADLAVQTQVRVVVACVFFF